MSIIRRIVDWIWKFFRKLFGKQKVTKKIQVGIKNAKNKRYLKGYGVFVEDSYSEMIPPYLIVTKEKKKKLLEKLAEASKPFENNQIVDEKMKMLFKTIMDNPLSLYQNEKISECIDSFITKSDLEENLEESANILSNDIMSIMDNYGQEIKEEVLSKYQKANYVTITNVILDKTYQELMALENDYRHHKYNKYYYNRKLKNIMDRIDDLVKMRDYNAVIDEIKDLRNDIYTKRKDKYDLLFNTEVFENINNSCEELMKKVNRRIIDIKKDEKEKQEVKQKQMEEEQRKNREREQEERRQRELQEMLFKRFKDLELARKLLLINYNEKNISKNDMIQSLNECYYEFLNGERADFFFERNKTKLELVKLLNNMNYMNSIMLKQEHIMIDHINYKMDDLITAVLDEKDALEENLKRKYHYIKEQDETSTLVNNKLDIMQEKENERKRVDTKVKTLNNNGFTLRK